jgi:hypothetical protein
MKLEDVLARMVHRRHEPACSGNPAHIPWYGQQVAELLATPEGKALAALVEAAVALHGFKSDRPLGDPEGIDEEYADLWTRLNDFAVAVAEYLRLGDVA